MSETALEFLARRQEQQSRSASLFPRSGLARLDEYRARKRRLVGSGGKEQQATSGAFAQESNPQGSATPARTPAVIADFPTEVIEISGLSQSGKSEVVLSLCLQTLLPRKLGGEEASVVFFDLDGRFLADRLIGLLDKRLLEAIEEGKLEMPKAREIFRNLMDCMYIFRCENNLEVLSTISSFSEKFIQERQVRLVVFESISTFHFEDLENEPVSAGLHVSVPLAIKRLIKTQLMTILCTKSCIYQPKPGKRVPEYLSQTWHNLVTLRLFAERIEGNHRFRISDLDKNEQIVLEFNVEHDGIYPL